MKQILPVLGRFFAISLTSFGGITYANWLNHQGYWNGTIRRVQTADFNMLSHMLPTKLSYTLIRRDSEELQRTIDSNYGLFGMVVTDCKAQLGSDCLNEEILYASNSKYEWKKQLSPESLSDAPYSILRNPPPSTTESGFADTRAQTWDATGKANSGEIIGRVYYVRGIPPTFWVDYQRWFSKLPESLFVDSGAQKYYSLTLLLFGIGGLGAFSFVEWSLYCKRVQKHQAQKDREQLLKELERLRQQLRERLRQMSSLIAQREQFVNELAAHQQQERQATQRLEQMTEHFESQLAQQKQLVQQNGSTETLEKNFSKLREENQENKQTISDLQQKIVQAQQTQIRGGNTEVVRALERELEEVERRNRDVQEQGRASKRLIDNLRAEVAFNERKQRETENVLAFFQTQAEDAKQREQEANLTRQEMNKTIAELKEKVKQGDKEIGLLEDRIDKEHQDSDDLNMFERSVLGCLQSSLKCQADRWRVLHQFDVSQQRGVRRITDFIVIGQSCVFIVEAKYYLGKISAEGDVRNMPWTCQTTSGRKVVKTPGGNNPYKQVTGYTDSMKGRVELARAGGRIGVYGIVVFPEGADVTQINDEIGGHYRVTTLDRLIQVIQDLETAFIQRSHQECSNLSPKQLEDLICRKLFIPPVRKRA